MQAMRSHVQRATFVGLLSVLLVASVPDVKYTTVSTFKMSGFLGRLVGRSLPDELPETASLSGDKLRIDDEYNESSTLIDLAAETFTTLNHKQKTYSTITFDELKQQLEQRLEEARQEREENAEDAEDAPDTEIEFAFAIDRTGERKQVNGYNAERVIMTIEAEGTAQDPETQETAGGQVVMASELWVSNAVPGYAEIQAFQQRFAEKMGDVAFGGQSQDQVIASIAKAMGNQEGDLEEQLQKAREEAGKIDGLAVQSTTHVVSVPYGMAFDADQVFAEASADEPQEEKKKRGGLRGLKKALEDATQNAAGSGVPEQKTLFTISSIMDDFQQLDVPAATYDIPADYKEKPFTM